ncbi:tetratricopeptide (TPR) repeat protein [Sphingopyxis panaciterrae]|uniref:tetratricopeptide repeat-containing sulfotransferase family protein n=1 Tax=Sphingopyxis panaciterrae TaxID=363841 RepID=UPI00141EBAAE|nr:tetratricopeptide repeat-containing sulfotransferase family protein [Sphingopyxis panaciterrae]NIJ39627.1 tetratricopeptide (TPR) repeat protein [Sphingopyxis panaciterrae]
MLDSRTADVLKQAVGAAQAGEIERARAIAEGALATGGDGVALNAFLGMLLARSGDLAGAARHLATAHRGRPSDATIACNLIAVLIDTGELAQAFDVATRDLARADSTLRVARYRGFISQSLERFPDAVEAYEQVVTGAPDDFESWNNLGNARSATGDLEGSVVALERAMALNSLAPPTRLNLAVAWRSVGRDEEAEALLKRTVEEFPGDARALHELYVQYKKEGRQDEAMAAIEGAVALDPDNANLQLKFGVECGLLHRTAEAEQAFRKAIAADPSLTDAYLGLTVQYEHSNREEEFAPLIAMAEAHGLDDGALAFMRAFELRRAKRFDEALASLDLVPADMEAERATHLRGQLLDRLGRVDEAFEAFSATTRLHMTSPTQPLERAAALREKLRGELDLLTPEWTASWPDAREGAGRSDPVFLLGFPRSGTTLLDTILMGHPGTTVLEEQPPLNNVDKHIGGMTNIPELDAAAVDDARHLYFDEVAKVAPAPFDPARMLIDKSPLFLSKAVLIQRLFPEARFILALRHPCDVLLSCFMSNFRLNDAMSNFLRLEDAAEFYDLTFQHWERARSLFALNVHTIVYERLVEDVETEVRPLFDFLGLEWHADALDHRTTAKARGLITTASYAQVVEPIYKRAAGRWEGYRRHLEPILPVLRPWAEKFGYDM